MYLYSLIGRKPKPSKPMTLQEFYNGAVAILERNGVNAGFDLKVSASLDSFDKRGLRPSYDVCWLRKYRQSVNVFGQSSPSNALGEFERLVIIDSHTKDEPETIGSIEVVGVVK